ncbi:MAG: twin-arginine translocase TatA/TatE family subunit [Terracidiphilus sp.]
MGTPPIQMANLGMADSLILMVMALVVFGPRRLPQIGRQIGKLMYEFRKASNDFKFQMEEELRTAEEADRRKKEEERLRGLALAAPAQPALPETASQISDSSPGAPTEAASQTPAVNPGALNEIMAAENIDGRGRAPVKLEAPIEEAYPRIMPPSTGEQIAASRPNSLTALAPEAKEPGAVAGVEAEQASNPESGVVDAMVSEGGPAGESAPEPEQAAHHG